MHHRGIDRNCEIGEHGHRRRVGHVGEFAAEMTDIAMARQKLGVVAAQLALDAQEGNAARNAPLRQ